MKTMSAVYAKTNFGRFIEEAQREPVLVTKKNRPVGVFFSMQDIEDTIWSEKAKQADAEGYLSKEESTELLNNMLNARD